MHAWYRTSGDLLQRDFGCGTRLVPLAVVEHNYRVAVGGDRLTL